MKTTYESSGIVLGNYWGGGSGSYPASKYNSHSKEDLIEQNEQALKSGALDSGMGYESLIGALITIKTINTTFIEGKEFINEEYEDIFIGNLKEEEMEFLQDCIYY